MTLLCKLLFYSFQAPEVESKTGFWTCLFGDLLDKGTGFCLGIKTGFVFVLCVWHCPDYQSCQFENMGFYLFWFNESSILSEHVKIDKTG